MSEQITVTYTQEGADGHLLSLDSPAMADIHIDYTGIPVEKRAGSATRLLCASALYCFAGTVQMALTSRGAHIRSLTGRAVATEDRDARGHLRVVGIAIEMKVDLPPEERPILDKCRLLVRDGCKITASLHEGIPVEYQIIEEA